MQRCCLLAVVLLLLCLSCTGWEPGSWGLGLARKALDLIREESELGLASLNNVLLLIGIFGRVVANSARQGYANIRQDEAIDVAVDVEALRRDKCRVLLRVGEALAESLDAWAAAELQAVAVIRREGEWCAALGHNASPWCRAVRAFDHEAYAAAAAGFREALAAVQLMRQLLQCEARPGLHLPSAMAFCRSFSGSRDREAELCVESAYWFQLPANRAEFCHLFCDMTAASTLREWPNWQCMHHECRPRVLNSEPERFQAELFERLVVEMEEHHSSSAPAANGAAAAGADAAAADGPSTDTSGTAAAAAAGTTRVAAGTTAAGIAAAAAAPASFLAESGSDAWEAVYRRQLPLDVLQDAVQAEILAGGDLLGEISSDLERGVYLGAFDADVQPEILFGGVMAPLFSALGWSRAEGLATAAIWAGTTRLAVSGYQINQKRLQQRKGVKADARALKSLKLEAADDIQHGMCAILETVHHMNVAALELVAGHTPLQVKNMMRAMGARADAAVDETAIAGARAALRRVFQECTCTQTREASGVQPIVEVRLLVTERRPWLHSYHAKLASAGFSPAGVVAKTRNGRPMVSLWARRGSAGDELPLSRLVVTRANRAADTLENLQALEISAKEAFVAAAAKTAAARGTERTSAGIPAVDYERFTDLLRQGTLMRSADCYNNAGRTHRRRTGGDDAGDEEADHCRAVLDRFDVAKGGDLDWSEFLEAFWQLSVVQLTERSTHDDFGAGAMEARRSGLLADAADGGAKKLNKKYGRLYGAFQWDVWQMHDEAAPILQLHAEDEEAVQQTNATWTSLHHHYCPFVGPGGDTSVEVRASCYVYLGDFRTSLWYANIRYNDPVAADRGKAAVRNEFDNELSRATFDRFRRLRLDADPFAHAAAGGGGGGDGSSGYSGGGGGEVTGFGG